MPSCGIVSWLGTIAGVGALTGCKHMQALHPLPPVSNDTQVQTAEPQTHKVGFSSYFVQFFWRYIKLFTRLLCVHGV